MCFADDLLGLHSMWGRIAIRPYMQCVMATPNVQ